MNKKEYLEMRNNLLAEAEKLIAEGKTEEAKEKMKEVEDLDNKWEEIKLAQANMNALKDKVTGINLANNSVDVKDLRPVDNVQVTQKVDEKELYKQAWAKYMMDMALTEDEKVVFNEVNTRFHNSIQTANTHAVVIPDNVTEDIWKEAAELYPIIDDLNMTFVPGDMTIIKETDSGDDAAWYDEDTEVADGDFAIGELNLTGCELAKAIPISWKLKKMSIERFIPYITSLLAEKMGAALAKGVVSGKGKPGIGDTFKPEPLGIITALEAEEGTPQIIEYNSELSYEDLTNAMSKMKSGYKTGAAIYAKSDVIWNVLANLKDNDGRPLFIPDVTLGGVGRMFGLPVKEDDSIPDDAILFANVGRGYAINVNENMTIYTEDHVKARYTDYMAYAIIDGAPLTNKAFALVRKALPEG
ncbi:phage major capsid protein [Tepidimicrobium xylanilyticum]